MPPSRDEDLDWLYGRDQAAAAPELTRVMPSPYGAPAPPVPPTEAPPPAAPSAAGPARYPTAQPPPAPPAVVPANYPSMPGYGDGRAVPPRGPGAPGGPGTPGGPGFLGGPSGGKPTKRRHPVRNTLRVLMVLLLLIVVWLVGVPAYAWSHVDRVDDNPGGKRPADQPGTTFLIVGSDSREGLTKAQQKKLGTGSVGGQRTDTMMLLYIPRTGKPALISIPRDSYVAIPEHGKNKINTAYAFGGPQLLVQTVESNTGLRVDGYLEIGFGGFVQIIDALDGIRMCLPAAIDDRDSHLNLKKGCQTLSGTNALGYVRMRKADPRGDLGRVERQRQMLAAVAKKAASPSTLVNPFRYWTLCNASADSVKLGEDTSLLQTLSLGLAMRKIANDEGLTLTVPVSDPNATTPVGSSVLWDAAKAQAMFAEIGKGDTSKLGKYAK
jgi:LCP family protein required for cell wall assembly